MQRGWNWRRTHFHQDQDRRAPLRRLEISLSQGVRWKALINKYIAAIPLSGDAPGMVAQSMSCGPSPRAAGSTAMIAKVGAAASESQSAAPRVMRRGGVRVSSATAA
jgi:hypothetical protein